MPEQKQRNCGYPTGISFVWDNVQIRLPYSAMHLLVTTDVDLKVLKCSLSTLPIIVARGLGLDQIPSTVVSHGELLRRYWLFETCRIRSPQGSFPGISIRRNWTVCDFDVYHPLVM